MFPDPLDVISDVQRPQGLAFQALPHRQLRPPTFSEQGVSQPKDEYSRSFFSFPSIVEPPAGLTDGASRKETQREYRMPGAFPTYSTNSAPDKDTQKENVKPSSYPAAPANCAPRKETRGEKRKFDSYERLAASTPGNHFEASKAAAAKAKAGYYQKLEADVKAAAQEKNTAREPFSQFVATDKAEGIEDKAGADAAAAAKVERVEAYMQEMRERYSIENAERVRGENAMDAYSKKGSTRRPATSYEQDLQSIQLEQQAKAKELRDAEAKKAEETKAKMAEYAAKKAQAEAEREECRRDPVNVVAMQFGYELRRRDADARRAKEAAKKAQADTEAEKTTLEVMKRAEDAKKTEEKKRAEEAAEKAQAEAEAELVKEMEAMERAKAERKKRIDDAAKKAVDEALAQFTRKRAEEAKQAAETKKAEDAKNIEAACLAEQKRVQETYAKMAAETWRARNARKLEATTLQTDLRDTAKSVAKQGNGAQDANKNNYEEAAKAQTATKTAERLAELNKTFEEAQLDVDAKKAEIVKKQNDAWYGMRKPFHTLKKEAARNDAASTSTDRPSLPKVPLSQALADWRNPSKETAPPKAGSESKVGQVNEDTLQGEQDSSSVYNDIPELVPISPRQEPADQRNAPKENLTPKALPDLDFASLGGWAACLRSNPEDITFANNFTPFTALLPGFIPLSLEQRLANRCDAFQKESLTPTAAMHLISESFARHAEDVKEAEKVRDKGNAKKVEQREDPWKVKKMEQAKWAEKFKREGVLQGEQESGVVYDDSEKVKEMEKIRDRWIAKGAQEFKDMRKLKDAESVNGWEGVEDPDQEEWEIVDGK
jgi:hypothetical protein